MGYEYFYLFTKVRILLLGFRYEHERMYIIYANKFSIQPHEKKKNALWHVIHWTINKIRLSYIFIIIITSPNLFSSGWMKPVTHEDVHLLLDWQFHAPLSGFHLRSWILYLKPKEQEMSCTF